jgi:hypothetical protein
LHWLTLVVRSVGGDFGGGGLGGGGAGGDGLGAGGLAGFEVLRRPRRLAAGGALDAREPLAATARAEVLEGSRASVRAHVATRTTSSSTMR